MADNDNQPRVKATPPDAGPSTAWVWVQIVAYFAAVFGVIWWLS